jgi:hypothetical protein
MVTVCVFLDATKKKNNNNNNNNNNPHDTLDILDNYCVCLGFFIYIYILYIAVALDKKTNKK